MAGRPGAGVAGRGGRAGGSLGGLVDRFADAAGFGLAASGRHPRGDAVAATATGLLAVAFCGWAQVSADSWLSTLLTVGALIGFVLAVVGLVRAANAPRTGAPLKDRGTRDRYTRVLVVEVVVAVLGLLVLAFAGLLVWSPIWLCAVIGVHLAALSGPVGSWLLVPAGAGMVVSAVLALLLSVVGLTAPATVSGAGAGLCLLVAAVVGIRGRAARTR